MGSKCNITLILAKAVFKFLLLVTSQELINHCKNNLRELDKIGFEAELYAYENSQGKRKTLR